MSKLYKKTSCIFSLVMIVCLLMSFDMLSCFALSSKTPSIVIGSARGKAGDTVDVTITMSDNPGFVSANLYVNYDEDLLTLKNVKDGGLLSGVTHSDNYTSPYGLCWVNDLAKENFKVNGVLATLTFEISKNAKPGKTIISLEQDILDCDIENVVFKLTDGNVEVGNSSAKSENSKSISGDSQNSENSEKTYNQSSDTNNSSSNSNKDLVTESSTENSNADNKETDNIKSGNSASVLSSTTDSAQNEGSTSSVWIIALAIILILVLISVGGYVFCKRKRKN